MTPSAFLAMVLDPGLEVLAGVGGPEPTFDARRWLLCVALQESGLIARYQNSPDEAPGPARGWWQFEEQGGVLGVLTHYASEALAVAACELLEVVPETGAVWRALEGHDLLSTCFARLLLWTDPDPLPAEMAAGWDMYLDLWRPGLPRPEAWPDNWALADAAASAPIVS